MYSVICIVFIFCFLFSGLGQFLLRHNQSFEKLNFRDRTIFIRISRMHNPISAGKSGISISGITSRNARTFDDDILLICIT